MTAPRIWIAWETQRRSLGLSRRLGADLRLVLHSGWKRYPLCIAETVALLARCRGRTVFAQNPSMVLAALAGLLKVPFGYRLVVDRHSNFAFLAGAGAGLKRRVSDLLSGFTLRRADLTLVTNSELQAHVEKAGGRAFVLPDPFPDLSAYQPKVSRNEAPGSSGAAADASPRPREILFVSSWAFDEPISAAMQACRKLRGQIIMRITGRPPAAWFQALAAAPVNFIPTGFLSEAEFFARMAESDAVMAVTSRAATLVCGGYEGASLGKPLILGGSAALREYFDAGCVYTDGSAADLEFRIRNLLTALPAYREQIRAWLARRSKEWESRLEALERALAGTPGFNPGSDRTHAPAGCEADAEAYAAGSAPAARG